MSEDPPTTYEVGAAIDAWRNNDWWQDFAFTAEALFNSDNYHLFYWYAISANLDAFSFITYSILVTSKYFLI